MSEQELSQRLINNIVNKLTEEINQWSNNLRLKAEAELYESARAVVDKYSNALSNVDRELNLEREYRLYNEIMRAKRERLKILDQAYESLINKVKERIRGMRGTDDYKAFIKNTLMWAISIVGSNDVIIYTSKADEGVVKEVATELGLTADVKSLENNEIVGLIVETRDRAVTVDATLDARIRLMEHQIKTLLAQEAAKTA
ncbi:V-type ATP synthase subunit E [Vulcanisaeta thermophila]|uniref:V-type ATP synthase subunit E n=1 Tax=Vulcanisaeta thermophila TaxID=867917 RepID=UPI000852CD29|nr:V-type ATP synthase subunit E [Vulcanisaeta thermophila]